MPLCGAAGCGSTTAELKCARCQGVFYCNAACQKLDWKRHKPFCKPLPNSGITASSPPTPRMQRGRVSTSAVDSELHGVVNDFVVRIRSRPKSVRSDLASVLKFAETLLARGARPDVLISRAFDKAQQHVSCVGLVCSAGIAGLEPLLELLLAADCKPAVDPNAACERVDAALVTPVTDAIHKFQPSLLRLLIAHGADLRAPCSQNAAGQIEWPVRLCVESVVQAVINSRTFDDALETLDCLISAGAAVDAFDGRWFGDALVLLQQTPLLSALQHPGMPPRGRAILDVVARKLIHAGANVHARDCMQMRPLDRAAMLPSLDIFKALIGKGADPSPTPYVGAVAPGQPGAGQQVGTHYLQFAILDGRADVLQAAAEAGVNLHKVKSLGQTSAALLAYAVIRCRRSCVRFLLEYGCDVNELHVTPGEPAAGIPDMESTACDLVFLGRGTADERARIMAALRAAGGKCYTEL